jgi:hypothetical protein
LPDRLKLVWDKAALEDLANIAQWSQPTARRVVEAMEHMAELGWSLGHPTDRPGVRYWPVRPLGVLYKVMGAELHVIEVIDVRQLRGHQP